MTMSFCPAMTGQRIDLTDTTQITALNCGKETIFDWLNSFSAVINFRRQILTSKVDPRAGRIK